MRIRDGYEPHGNMPYQITPELPAGSYFENLSGRSERVEGTAALYLPSRRWAGQHDLKLGIDLDHVGYERDRHARAGELSARRRNADARRARFPRSRPSRLHNVELGAYVARPLAAARRLAGRAGPSLRLG